MRAFRYFLLAAIVGIYGYVSYFHGIPFWTEVAQVRDLLPSQINTAYEECVFTDGLPVRGSRAVPVAELNTHDRNIVLGCAAESGSANFVRWALKDAKEPLSIESKYNGRWPVEWVAGWADGQAAVKILALLLEPNNAVWKTNSSASLMAALYGAKTVDAADYLVRHYPFLLEQNNRQSLSRDDIQNYFGLTLAQYHAYQKRLDLAEYFAGKGIKVAVPDQRFRHWLLDKDRNKLLDDKLDAFLTAHGVPPDERDNYGRTVLHAATVLHDEQLVAHYLVARGVNANVADRAGDTPLHEAARQNRLDLVKLLLARANPNARNHKGQTPLHEAFAAAAWDIAYVLLDKGARLDVRDNVGRTPLFACVSRGCPMLDRLAASGAAFDVRDNAGNSLLHEAAASNDTSGSMAQMLVARGAQVDAKNLEGKTALHIAADRNNHAMVRLLLDKGVSANAADNLGNTPLHLAHAPDIVEALLEAGANPDLANKGGMRPVNGTVARSRMLFHSPAQIRSKLDTLPRYFADIRVHGEYEQAVELATPTSGAIGRVIQGLGNSLSSGEVEFVPRGAALEFRVQQACQAGASLREGDEALMLDRLPVYSTWQELTVLEDKPRTFRAVIVPDKCELPTITPETIQTAIAQTQPAAIDKWQAATQACSRTEGRCTIFMRPVLRIQVKNAKEWREAGLLYTHEEEIQP